MSTIKIPLKFTDRRRSRAGSATTCVIATAAKRQWGGHWMVTPRSVERVSGNGQVMRWRPSAGARLVMFLFDLGLPVPARSIRLIRGKTVPPRRVRKARRAAAGVACGGALLLGMCGLAWVVLTIIGAAIAVLTVVTAVKLRSARLPAVRGRTARPQAAIRAGHPSGTTAIAGILRPQPAIPGAPEPAGPLPAITLPARRQPELEPVQAAAPKAEPKAISEPAAQAPAEIAAAAITGGSQ